MNERIIVIHFVLMAIGLILLFINTYFASYLISKFSQNEFKISLVSGPFILISSLFVFLFGVANSKKSE